MKPTPRELVWRILIDFLLTVLWSGFVYSNLVSFFLYHKPASFLLSLYETIIMVLFLIRTHPVRSSTSIFDYIISIAGTFIIFFYRPILRPDSSLTTLVLILGLLIGIASIFSLNRSHSIIPAERAIKTKGLYAYIRHPIYLSYFIIFISYFFNNPSLYNGVILVIAYALLIIRIFREEAYLLKNDLYKEYTKKVRWRLIPRIF